MNSYFHGRRHPLALWWRQVSKRASLRGRVRTNEDQCRRWAKTNESPADALKREMHGGGQQGLSDRSESYSGAWRQHRHLQEKHGRRRKTDAASSIVDNQSGARWPTRLRSDHGRHGLPRRSPVEQTRRGLPRQHLHEASSAQDGLPRPWSDLNSAVPLARDATINLGGSDR